MSIFPGGDDGLKRGAAKFGGKPDTVRDAQKKIRERVNEGGKDDIISDAKSLKSSGKGESAAVDSLAEKYPNANLAKLREIVGAVYRGSYDNGLIPTEPEPYGAGVDGAATEQNPQVDNAGDRKCPACGGPTIKDAKRWDKYKATGDTGPVRSYCVPCDTFWKESAFENSGNDSLRARNKWDSMAIRELSEILKKLGVRETIVGTEWDALPDNIRQKLSEYFLENSLQNSDSDFCKPCAIKGDDVELDANGHCSKCGEKTGAGRGEKGPDGLRNAGGPNKNIRVEALPVRGFSVSWDSYDGTTHGTEYDTREEAEQKAKQLRSLQNSAADNCDGSGPHSGDEVRRLPTSAEAGGGAVILCRNCWKHEMEWRKERNTSLEGNAKFPILDFSQGERYNSDDKPATGVVLWLRSDFTQRSHWLQMAGIRGDDYAHEQWSDFRPEVQEAIEKAMRQRGQLSNSDSGAVSSASTGFDSAQKTTTAQRSEYENYSSSHSVCPLCQKSIESDSGDTTARLRQHLQYGHDLSTGHGETILKIMETGGNVEDYISRSGLKNASDIPCDVCHKSFSPKKEGSFRQEICDSCIRKSNEDASAYQRGREELGEARENASVPCSKCGADAHLEWDGLSMSVKMALQGGWDRKNAAGHKLVIDSRNDAMAHCSCGHWSYASVGEMDDSRVKTNFDLHKDGVKENAGEFDWDKELGDCPCGHSMNADHKWTSGPGGLVRWCAKCACKHTSGPSMEKKPCPVCGTRENSGDCKACQKAPAEAGKHFCEECARKMTLDDKLRVLKQGPYGTKKENAADGDFTSRCLGCGHLSNAAWSGKCEAGCGAKYDGHPNGDKRLNGSATCNECGRSMTADGKGGWTGHAPGCSTGDRKNAATFNVHCPKCDALTPHSGDKATKDSAPDRQCTECETTYKWNPDGSGAWEVKNAKAKAKAKVKATQYICPKCNSAQVRYEEIDGYYDCGECGWMTQDGRRLKEWVRENASTNIRCSCGGRVEKIGEDSYECDDCGMLYETDDWSRPGNLKLKPCAVQPNENSLKNSGYSAVEPWMEATIDERGGWLLEAGQSIELADRRWDDLSQDVKVALQNAWDRPVSRNNAAGVSAGEWNAASKDERSLYLTAAGVAKEHEYFTRCGFNSLPLTVQKALGGTPDSKADGRFNSPDYGNRAPEFIAWVKQVASANGKSEDEIFRMWKEHVKINEGYDQSPLTSEFLDWNYLKGHDMHGRPSRAQEGHPRENSLENYSNDICRCGHAHDGEVCDDCPCRIFVKREAPKENSLDGSTAAHLNAWLEKTLRPELRDSALAKILSLIAEQPDLADGSRAWTEVAHMAGVWNSSGTKCVSCGSPASTSGAKNEHGAGFLCAKCAPEWNKDVADETDDEFRKRVAHLKNGGC